MIGRVYILKAGNNEVYIGSTTLKIGDRLKEHKSHYKRFLQGKTRYISACDIFRHGMVEYDVIEMKCQNVQELRKREEMVRTAFRQDPNYHVVNRQRSGNFTSPLQYQRDHKDEVNAYQRMYRRRRKMRAELKDKTPTV